MPAGFNYGTNLVRSFADGLVERFLESDNSCRVMLDADKPNSAGNRPVRARPPATCRRTNWPGRFEMECTGFSTLEALQNVGKAAAEVIESRDGGRELPKRITACCISLT